MSHQFIIKLYLRLAAISGAAVFVFSSCVSRPGGYEGYMTASYHVRGKSYTPMSVEDALAHCAKLNDTGGPAKKELR
jgi:hypothetical protein